MLCIRSLFKFFTHLISIHHRHHNIKEYQIREEFFCLFQTLYPVSCCLKGITLILKHSAKEPDIHLLIVNYKEFLFFILFHLYPPASVPLTGWLTGIVKLNLAPLPVSLSTQILPL